MTLSEGPSHERTDTVVQTPTAVNAGRVESADSRVDVVAPVSRGQVRTASSSRFAPDAVVAALVGLVLLVVGLIAIVRGGFSGPMSEPVVKVLGFTHTTTLGLIDVGLGACLLIAGAARSRSGELFFAGVAGIAGFVGAVQTKSFKTSLALESSMAWLIVAAAVVVVLAALLLPRFAKYSTTIEQS